MYIPKHFKGEGREEAIAFMRRFNFASLITAVKEVPMATHLPFVIIEREGNVILQAHFAKANPQWKEIADKESLVIFSEPHAYISPSHYEKEQNVPTWNYVSVHVYGKALLIKDPIAATATLEAMMDSFEPEYKSQWAALSQEYKERMLKGIVAFELAVDRMQFNEKLSQDNKVEERSNIIEALGASKDSSERTIADYMRSKLSEEDTEDL